MILLSNDKYEAVYASDDDVMYRDNMGVRNTSHIKSFDIGDSIMMQLNSYEATIKLSKIRKR